MGEAQEEEDVEEEVEEDIDDMGEQDIEEVGLLVGRLARQSQHLRSIVAWTKFLKDPQIAFHLEWILHYKDSIH